VADAAWRHGAWDFRIIRARRRRPWPPRSYWRPPPWPRRRPPPPHTPLRRWRPRRLDGSTACDQHGDLRQALRTLTEDDHLAGAAVEVTDPVCGRWSDATGTADLGTGRPMNARDRLRIGSVTKTFTATVVLQLAAEHRVALDAPVARYLPGLIEGNGHDGRKITVRQLLQHTSGLPDYLDSPAWDHFERLRFRHFEPRELIARALRMPRPEGSGFHYATTNYLVTGRSAESEITRRIIDPLRLHDTY